MYIFVQPCIIIENTFRYIYTYIRIKVCNIVSLRVGANNKYKVKYKIEKNSRQTKKIKCYRVKSGNFGHQLISDSDLVYFIFYLLE